MDPYSKIEKWFHLIFGLSLLPSNKVDDCFVEDLILIQSLSEKLVEFSDYLANIYFFKFDFSTFNVGYVFN
jgi:hypothetical protein